jgi:hypothetical protein
MNYEVHKRNGMTEEEEFKFIQNLAYDLNNELNDKYPDCAEVKKKNNKKCLGHSVSRNNDELCFYCEDCSQYINFK